MPQLIYDTDSLLCPQTVWVGKRVCEWAGAHLYRVAEMSATNTTDLIDPPFDGVTTALFVVFMVIVVVGAVGNMLVIIVYILNRQMHDTTNTLIVNLAISDFLFIVFCVPPTAYQTKFYWFIGNNAFCKFVSYFQYVSMCD